MKAGNIEFVPARDQVGDSPKLRIQIQGDDGVDVGEIELVADDLTGDRQPGELHTYGPLELFAFTVDEARRKARYIKQFDNLERVRQELQEDLYEWHFRQRRDKERWEGLGDDAVNRAIMNR
jgi:hypothetical protein